MSLQQLVVQIQGLSSSDSDLQSLHDLLKGPATEALLKQQAGSILENLQSLSFKSHSLGCLYFLEARGRHCPPNQGDLAFFQETSRFLGTCAEEQIRRAPGCFSSLCSLFRAHAILLGEPKRAILPLLSAISIICPTPGAICPAHADVFQVCLLAKCYSAATPLLEHAPIAVNPKATGVTATDVLLYCYYGGMVYTGLRQYDRAQELYLAAVTAPTQVHNAITMGCLKKLILVSLLRSGKMDPLPKHVSTPVSRALKGECNTYIELARLAAAAGSGVEGATALSEYAISKAEIWRADGNAGLVKLVLDARVRRAVQCLTQTYATLATRRVAELAGLQNPADAEFEILRMVDAGHLHAKIDELQGMVEFLEDPEAFTSKHAWAKLDGLIQESMAMSGAVAEAHHAVSCDRSYLTKVEMTRSGGGMHGASAGMGMGADARSAGALADLDDAADDLFAGVL